MDRRDAGKAKRRRQILDAARVRIVEGGVDALVMRVLAIDAEVSVRTLYNLFGNKDDILDALVSELIRKLDTTLAGLVLEDPIARCRAIISVSSDRLIADQKVFRPILQTQVRSMRTYSESDRQSLASIQLAIEEAVSRRLISRQFSSQLLAQQIYSAHQHVILLWAHGILSDREFRLRAIHACALNLLAAGTPRTRTLLLAELPGMESELIDAHRKESPGGSIAS